MLCIRECLTDKTPVAIEEDEINIKKLSPIRGFSFFILVLYLNYPNKGINMKTNKLQKIITHLEVTDCEECLCKYCSAHLNGTYEDGLLEALKIISS